MQTSILDNGSHAEPLTTFVGREHEIAEVVQRVTQTRLLTLTGAGGVGKTRLARRVATLVAQSFADGVCWVSLAPLGEPSLVVQTIAHAIGIREAPGIRLEDQVIQTLQAKSLLVVLDNCEQVIDAAAGFARDALDLTSNVKFIATSRQPLNVAGEERWPVPPLSLADEHAALAEVADSDAVRLFVERTVAMLPQFHLTPENAHSVAQLCRQLDALPLAIELAAARMTVLTVQQITARLHQALTVLTASERLALDTRHHTLRAAIDWSYELLSADAQTVFRHLAVFAGGFTLEAAEAVAPTGSLIDCLSELVDKSLILAETIFRPEARYNMLETIRQYAAEQLTAHAESDAALERYLDCYVALAERAAPGLIGAEQAAWLTRLDDELDNFRAALREAKQRGRIESGLRLANALWRYCEMRGNYSEGRRWYEDLLAETSHGITLGVSAQASYCFAALLYRQAELEHANDAAEQALALQQQLDNTAGMASALNLLGVIAMDRSQIERAGALHERALALRRQRGDTWGIASSLQNLGLVAEHQGEYRRAVEYLEESLALKRQSGDRNNVALTLNNLCYMLILLGEYERARALLHESLAIYRELGDKHSAMFPLNNLALIAYYLDHYAEALAFEQEAGQLATELGSKHDMATHLLVMGDLAQATGDSGRALAMYEQALSDLRAVGEHQTTALALQKLAVHLSSLGDVSRAETLHREGLALYQQIGDRRGIAQTVEGLAVVAASRGEHARAVRALSAAAAAREKTGTPQHPPERRVSERILAELRTALGVGPFATAWAQGKTLSLDDAARDVLASHAPGSASPAPFPAGLTKREVEVLRLLARGLSNQEIADDLVISRRTVHAHVRSIFNKLDVTTRSGATRRAHEYALV